MMKDPYAVEPENWREGQHSLVRPYVAASGHNTNGLPAAMAGNSEFDFWEDPFIGSQASAIGPQASAADLDEVLASAKAGHRADKYATRVLADHPAVLRPRRHGKAPGPRSAALAAHRRALAAVVMVGAAAVAGTIFLVLPSHPMVMAMAGCGPNGCPVATATASISVTPGTSSAGGVHDPMHMSASQAATPQAGSPTPTVSTSATSPPSASLMSGSSVLAPGSVISIEATSSCCQSFSITHDENDNRVVIAQVTLDSSPTAQADAIWLVQQGLADSSCVSFESVNAPGEYLRHQHFELYLDPDDDSAQFAGDATFCPRPGNSGQGYSFESYNDPQLFIRHFDDIVYIASDGGSNSWDTATSWHYDTTWNVIQYLS